MGILDTVKAASFTGPTRLALHSVEGFGKTTLAAFFPSPLFVCGERGFPRDLGHAPKFVEPKSWEEVRALVHELMQNARGYESLVFDTMDWIEPLIWRYVCQRDTNRKTEMNPKGNTLESIEDYGYGKGYVATLEEMRSLLNDLDTLQTKQGMHVVILIHSHVKPFNNPAGDNFDRWQPKLHEKCARIIVEWSENVFFGYFEITTAKQDSSNKREKAKGASTGRRILGTRHNAMYDAKNRYNLPDTIELGNPVELMPYLLGKHIKPPKDAGSVAPGKSKDLIANAGGDGPPLDMKTKLSAPEEEKKGKPAPTDGNELQAALKEKYEQLAPASAAAPDVNEDEKKSMMRAAAMLDDVEAVCGKKARRDVEKWVAAADDNEKLQWCFTKAAEMIAAKKKASAKDEKIAERHA